MGYVHSLHHILSAPCFYVYRSDVCFIYNHLLKPFIDCYHRSTRSGLFNHTGASTEHVNVFASQGTVFGWTQLPSNGLPSRYGHTSVFFTGLVYVICGSSDSNVWAYTVSTSKSLFILLTTICARHLLCYCL